MKMSPLLFLIPLAAACARIAADDEVHAASPVSDRAPGSANAIDSEPEIAIVDTGSDAADPFATGGPLDALNASKPKVATQTPAPEPIDLLTSDRIRQAFLNDASLAADAPGVSVSTGAGIVQLTGSVRTEPVRQRMGTVAGAVGGVTRVQNQIAIAPAGGQVPSGMDDSTGNVITERVRQAFLDDASVAQEVANVAVTAQDTVVQLTGSVRNEVVHQRVVAVTRAVGSVTRVDDQLTVRER
jgi:osmotically-inducible protein OsmY